MKKNLSTSPVGVTPALLEAIRLNIPKEFHEKIRLGGYIALESIKTIPNNIINCYMKLELNTEPTMYVVNHDIRMKVTKLNADLIEPESMYKPLDKLFASIVKGEYPKEKVRFKDYD